MPRWGRTTLIVIGLVLQLASRAAAQEPFLPELTRPVNDFAGVVRPDDAADMQRQIEVLKQATGDVVIVATTPTFAPFADIREYAVKLFENHGRGVGEKGKDNGLLILLAVNDRRVWMEVGYGLEGYITDGFAGETSRDYMVPAFRKGDYSAGLRAGLARVIGRIADGRGVTLDGVQPVRQRTRRGGAPSTSTIIFLIIVFLVLALNSMSGGGPRRGGRFRGGWGRSRGWSGWSSGVGPFGGGFGGLGGGGFGGGGFGGGFGGFGGGRSGGGGGGAGW